MPRGDDGMRRAHPKPRGLVRVHRLAEGAQALDELGLAGQELRAAGCRQAIRRSCSSRPLSV